MTTLSVALVQTSLAWQSPGANRQRIEAALGNLGEADLIVLPEMFTTGFSATDTTGAEVPDGETERWMRVQSDALDAAVYGSIKINDAGRHFNRGLFVQPNGQVRRYDKRHLFRMAGEHRSFSPGAERVVVHYRGFRLLLQICYDLRFPVWMRNRNDYDAIIVIANWPSARGAAWRALLIARAIENSAYCIGVNRIGQDGHGVEYSGDSLCADFKGNLRADLNQQDTSAIVTLDLAELNAFREKFPVHLDADRFDVVDV